MFSTYLLYQCVEKGVKIVGGGGGGAVLFTLGTPVSHPECQILIFVYNQFLFSFKGRQTLAKLSPISRTFWFTEIKLRRVRDIRDDSVTVLR